MEDKLKVECLLDYLENDLEDFGCCFLGLSFLTIQRLLFSDGQAFRLKAFDWPNQCAQDNTIENDASGRDHRDFPVEFCDHNLGKQGYNEGAHSCVMVRKESSFNRETGCLLWYSIVTASRCADACGKAQSLIKVLD